MLPSQDCSSGKLSEKVWLSPNKGHAPESQAFELVATSAKGTAKGEFFARLAPAPLPPTTTTTTVATTTSAPPVTSGASTAVVPFVFPAAPPETTTTLPVTTATTTAPTTTTTTTTVPTTTTTAPTTTTSTTAPNPNQSVQVETSSNWSGYVMTGSQPYTELQGTFTVPDLTTSETCDSKAVEWVGVDGSGLTGGPGDQDLIQAGIQESATDGNGACGAPDNYYISVWWEILPEYQTEVPITSWDNGDPTTDVQPGDQVTVTIGQVSARSCSSLPSGDTCWGIEVQDDRTGEVFITDQPYGGPGSSAEWIMEDPSQASNPDCTTNPSPPPYECPMPDYTPAVQFTGLGITPSTYNNLYEEVLVQNGQAVSSPSALDDNYDFDVSYTGGTQGSPEGSGSHLAITSHPLSGVVPDSGGATTPPFATKS